MPRAPSEPPQTPAAPAAAPERLAALPPNEAPRIVPVMPRRPEIRVLRAGRQARPSREPAPPRRLAAIPPSAGPRTATDASPILVLRGGPQPRYALAGRVQPQSAAQPLIVVIRGARPRPIGLDGYVQPGPLILRVPH